MKNASKKPNSGKQKRNPEIESPENQHLRRFCDLTSQELATVLGALVGELGYALSTANSAAKDHATHTAVAAAERALGLARNLRYFSIHNKIQTEICDISQIVLDAVELVEKELELANIKITVLAEAGTFANVDGGAIQQLVLNLIMHARRSMPKGGQLTVSLRRTDDSIELKCVDTGPGTVETELESLGLSVSKVLVEAHGGKLSIDSKLGTGTSIEIVLPYDPKLVKVSLFPEERRFRRIHLSLPGEIFLSRGQTLLKTELSTLSVGGCFTKITDAISSPLPELNDSVSIRIQYFGSEVLEIARCRVASVSWAGIHSGLGIEFLDLEGRNRKLVEAIVKSHSS